MMTRILTKYYSEHFQTKIKKRKIISSVCSLKLLKDMLSKMICEPRAFEAFIKVMNKQYGTAEILKNHA